MGSALECIVLSTNDNGDAKGDNDDNDNDTNEENDDGRGTGNDSGSANGNDKVSRVDKNPSQSLFFRSVMACTHMYMRLCVGVYEGASVFIHVSILLG